jgi:hypothetical protein
MLFIKLILPSLGKYILFHLAKRRSNFSITLSQIALALKGAPKERPRYFIGKGDTVQPRILVRLSTLLTLPTGTNSYLLRLIFKTETSKHKKEGMQKAQMFGVSLQKSRVPSANKRWEI